MIQDFFGLHLVTRQAISVGEQREHQRIIVQRSRLLVLRNRRVTIAFGFQRLTKVQLGEVITGIHFEKFALQCNRFIVAARVVVIDAQIRVDDE